MYVYVCVYIYIYIYKVLGARKSNAGSHNDIRLASRKRRFLTLCACCLAS